MTDEYQIDNVTWAEKDGSGNIVVDSDVVNTEEITNGPIFAGNKSGSDADTRLDNALSDASDGDTIIAENAKYTSNKTVSNRLTLIGSGGGLGEGSQVESTFEIAAIGCVVDGLNLAAGSGKLLVSGNRVSVTNIGMFGNSPEIEVSGDNCMITKCAPGEVVFNSGTSGNIIDSCAGGLSVTDNGSNTVGDIA